MKKWISIAGVIAVIPVAGLLALSCVAGTPELGIEAGQLRPCPDTPNCVCSDGETGEAMIGPIDFSGAPEAAWAQLGTAIQEMGGQVAEDDGAYLHATFTSRLFRFVDDLECRLDAEARLIHVRSASRVGHSDLGVNRERVERLRMAFEDAAPASGN